MQKLVQTKNARIPFKGFALILYSIFCILSGNITSKAQTISVGNYHSAILCADSSILISGTNYKGQLGSGNTANVNHESINQLHIHSIATGGDHMLALTNSGKVVTWGYNKFGQLGVNNKTDSNTPTEINNLQNVSAIYAAYNSSFAILADGSLWAWGKNSAGQLGTNDTEDKTIPTKIQNIKGVKKVAIGQSFTIVLLKDGSVWSTGSNSFGQLGLGVSAQKNTFTQINTLSGIKDVASGSYHTLALTNGGEVFAWGNDNFGEFTMTTDTIVLAPFKIAALSDIKSVACGFNHSLVLSNTGNVYAFGLNYYGQLGDNSNNNSATPLLLTLPAAAKEIYAGAYVSFVNTTTGSLVGWGLNAQNQLGDNTNTNRLNPTTITTSCNILENQSILCNSLANFSLTDSTYCVGDSLRLINLSTNNLENTWLLNNSEQANSANFSSVLNQSGNFEAKLLINKFGCLSSKSANLAVYNKPNAQISVANQFCENQNAVAINPIETGGILSGNGISGMNFDPITAGIGTHQISYTISNAACSTTSNTSVDVLALAHAIFNVSQVGDSMMFQNLSQNSISYSWNFGDNNTSTDASVNHLYAAPGNYNVTLYSTSLCGTDSTTQMITVIPTGLIGSNIGKEKIWLDKSTHLIQIELPQSKHSYNLKFMDYTGKVILEKHNLGVSNYSISTKQLPVGVYVVSIYNNNYNSASRFVVEQ